MRIEGGEEAVYAQHEAIIYYAFVLERDDLMLALGSLLVDLCLLRSDKRLLIDIWVHLDIRVITELERVLFTGQAVDIYQGGGASYPFAVVDGHDEILLVEQSIWDVSVSLAQEMQCEQL